MNKRVLIVDGEERLQLSFQRLFGMYDIDVTSVTTLLEAETAAGRLDEFDLIIVAGRLQSREHNTSEIVRKYRKTYTGNILANSSNWEIARQLLDAGANGFCNKEDTLRKALSLLGIPFERK